MAHPVRGRFCCQVSPTFQVRPYDLAINIPVILNYVRWPKLREELAIPSPPTFPDEIEEAEPQELAVERHWSHRVIVLQPPEFGEIDVNVWNGAVVMDIVDAELATFLATKTGVIEEKWYPIEGVMDNDRSGRPPRPQDDLTCSAAVLLTARENWQREHFLTVSDGRGGALISRSLTL